MRSTRFRSTACWWYRLEFQAFHVMEKLGGLRTYKISRLGSNLFASWGKPQKQGIALNGNWHVCSARLTISLHVMSNEFMYRCWMIHILTRIHGFYFFLRVFFLPPVPVRLRFTVFGDLSFVLPLVLVCAAALPLEPLTLTTFFNKSFDLLCRWSIPSLPFALKCCWTNSLKAPSCASIVRKVVMNSS